MKSKTREKRRQRASGDSSWRIVAMVAVGIGVGFAVLLMSVAFGVKHGISSRLSNPLLKQSHLVNVARINEILVLLTIVVATAMLSETAASTFTVGLTLMKSRKEEVALRRQSGVLRSRLMKEFVWAISIPCVIGGLIGEACGIAVAWLLGRYTVLPIRFTPFSLLAPFPITVALAIAATLIPAWRFANASPALLRKG